MTYTPKKDPRKKVSHFDLTGHAHELTFSTDKDHPFFKDDLACTIFLEELGRSKEQYSFELWAYVVMATHVHLLIWPRNEIYTISKILSGIKGRTSTRYGKILADINSDLYNEHTYRKGDRVAFRFWLPRPGYDKNVWTAKIIHTMIKYIENNPVRSGLVTLAEEWKWSSAYSRKTEKSLIPNQDHIPFLYK